MRKLQFNYFPKNWKYAKVIPIPKSGKPAHDEINGYRPINLV